MSLIRRCKRTGEHQTGIGDSHNPATNEAWLQLPENMSLADMQIELYNPTGRLLYKTQPTRQFHKIYVAY